MFNIEALLTEVRMCRLCQEHLPLGAQPIIQLHPKSKILIAGQAPGIKVHKSGVPFDDASGKRLRSWLGLTREEFYNSEVVSILPMGFCYPGTGSSGDFPPRPECAKKWRYKLLSQLESLQLTVVIGQYAQAYHLDKDRGSVTENVLSWEKYWPKIIPLPHPSPRNNRWLIRNPWFEEELLPRLQNRVNEVLRQDG